MRFKQWENMHTVAEADVGGMNNVKPPSIQSRLRKKVAGLGAKYLQKVPIWNKILTWCASTNESKNNYSRTENNKKLEAPDPGINEDVTTAFMRSSLESNWSTSKPFGLQSNCVTATATARRTKKGEIADIFSHWWENP